MYMYIYTITCKFKPKECVILKVNSNVNYGLWIIWCVTANSSVAMHVPFCWMLIVDDAIKVWEQGI